MARTGKKAVFGFLPEGRFFAGANTAEGFQSFYPELFRDSELDALFRIEGGPGTGKSTLMKKAAETAEKLGAEVERYFCSSDPDSLDAVRIRPAGSTRLVALCDCTEPHPRAESSPGIVSRTVDLGRFRNDRKLASHRDEILRLQEQKASAYSAAYLYLSAAGKVRQRSVGMRVRQVRARCGAANPPAAVPALGEAPGHTGRALPHPAAQLCHAPAGAGRGCQDGQRAAGPRLGDDHAGRVRPQPDGSAAQRRRAPGRQRLK